MDFDNYNKYIITYSSPVPVRGGFYCEINGNRSFEEFYLEPTGEGRFCSFIEGYIDGMTAKNVENLSFKACRGNENEDGNGNGNGAENGFELRGIAVELVPVPAGGTFYFENEYYKVGVELVWGGGLSYFEDKACPVEGLTNILNHADTGRLVQQSYYGTGDPPYEKGEFMGNSWVYNPVQGGDRGNFKSKLIDYHFDGKTVRVKCRPRDWGHVGSYTFSYMENEYALEGRFLKVYNKFTDWSGYKHPVCGQETPAFYTVSYTDNFWFYNGEKPWQDDALEVRRDLIFWPEDWPRHRFPLRKDNTEKWCAWTDADDYGIGLYVPIAESYIAGRFMHNGTKDPAAGPTNYVAPITNFAIRCYEPFEYSYLITAGKLGEIRQRFKEAQEIAK